MLKDEKVIIRGSKLIYVGVYDPKIQRSLYVYCTIKSRASEIAHSVATVATFL